MFVTNMEQLLEPTREKPIEIGDRSKLEYENGGI